MKNLTQAGIVAPAKILPKLLPSAEWAAMGPQARREYAATMSRRYRSARAKLERGRLLDEFTAMTGLHRKYAIGLLSQGWKAKANQDLVASLRAMLQGRTGVRFVHVRGHSGIPLNERADELARRAIAERTTRVDTYISTPMGVAKPWPRA